jgi:hypothetical protein
MTRDEWKEMKKAVDDNDLFEEFLDGYQLEDAFFIGYEFAMADKMFGEE